jgi:hypothetical protein
MQADLLISKLLKIHCHRCGRNLFEEVAKTTARMRPELGLEPAQILDAFYAQLTGKLAFEVDGHQINWEFA